MGTRYSHILPTVSSADDPNKTLEPVHQLRHFPETEEQARVGCINLLREMEYRSVRAAKMAYEHSDTYEMLHMAMAFLVSCSAGIAGTGITDYVLVFKVKEVTKLRSFGYMYLGCLTLTLSSGLGVLFYDKLLPHVEEKHKALNRAGAEWQTLQLKLKTFRTSYTQKDLSLRELRKRCYKFIEERKEICEIAKPCQWLHNKYVDDYENLLESEGKDSEAVKRYFEAIDENHNREKSNVDRNTVAKQSLFQPDSLMWISWF